MGWLYERHIYPSTRNGTLIARRLLGRWKVSTNGVIQTNAYTNQMWYEAFKRVESYKQPQLIQEALMLGLGGGGAVKPLHTIFSTVRLTAIEDDLDMIQLAHTLRLNEPAPFPEIIAGDARGVVNSLHRKFDLIILDIFRNKRPAFEPQDSSFISTLKNILDDKGILLINVAGMPNFLENMSENFSHSDRWQHKGNYLGAFW